MDTDTPRSVRRRMQTARYVPPPPPPPTRPSPKKQKVVIPSGPYDLEGNIKPSYRMQGEPYGAEEVEPGQLNSINWKQVHESGMAWDSEEVEPGQLHSINWQKVLESGMAKPEHDFTKGDGNRHRFDAAGNIEIGYTRIPHQKFVTDFDSDFKKAFDFVRGHEIKCMEDIEGDYLNKSLKEKAVSVTSIFEDFHKNIGLFLGRELVPVDYGRIVRNTSPDFEELNSDHSDSEDEEETTADKGDAEQNDISSASTATLQNDISRSSTATLAEENPQEEGYTVVVRSDGDTDLVKQYVLAMSGKPASYFEDVFNSLEKQDLEEEEEEMIIKRDYLHENGDFHLPTRKNASSQGVGSSSNQVINRENHTGMGSDLDLELIINTRTRGGNSQAVENNSNNDTAEARRPPRAAAAPVNYALSHLGQLTSVHDESTSRSTGRRYSAPPLFYPDNFPPAEEIVMNNKPHQIKLLAGWLHGKDINSVIDLTGVTLDEFEHVLDRIDKRIDLDGTIMNVVDDLDYLGVEESHPSGIDVEESHPNGIDVEESHTSGIDVDESYPSGIDVEESHTSGIDVEESHTSGIDVDESYPSGIEVEESYPSGIGVEVMGLPREISDQYLNAEDGGFEEPSGGKSKYNASGGKSVSPGPVSGSPFANQRGKQIGKSVSPGPVGGSPYTIKQGKQIGKKHKLDSDDDPDFAMSTAWHTLRAKRVKYDSADDDSNYEGSTSSNSESDAESESAQGDDYQSVYSHGANTGDSDSDSDSDGDVSDFPMNDDDSVDDEGEPQVPGRRFAIPKARRGTIDLISEGNNSDHEEVASNVGEESGVNEESRVYDENDSLESRSPYRYWNGEIGWTTTDTGAIVPNFMAMTVPDMLQECKEHDIIRGSDRIKPRLVPKLVADFKKRTAPGYKAPKKPASKPKVSTKNFSEMPNYELIAAIIKAGLPKPPQRSSNPYLVKILKDHHAKTKKSRAPSKGTSTGDVVPPPTNGDSFTSPGKRRRDDAEEEDDADDEAIPKKRVKITSQSSSPNKGMSTGNVVSPPTNGDSFKSPGKRRRDDAEEEDDADDESIPKKRVKMTSQSGTPKKGMSTGNVVSPPTNGESSTSPGQKRSRGNFEEDGEGGDELLANKRARIISQWSTPNKGRSTADVVSPPTNGQSSKSPGQKRPRGEDDEEDDTPRANKRAKLFAGQYDYMTGRDNIRTKKGKGRIEGGNETVV